MSVRDQRSTDRGIHGPVRKMKCLTIQNPFSAEYWHKGAEWRACPNCEDPFEEQFPTERGVTARSTLNKREARNTQCRWRLELRRLRLVTSL